MAAVKVTNPRTTSPATSTPFNPRTNIPTPSRLPQSPHPTSPLYGADDPDLSPPPTTGGGPLPSDVEVQGPPLIGDTRGGGNPVAPPSPVRPVFADPKIKSINDREESEHQLELERHRRRTERDSLLAQKAQAQQEGESRARSRNLAAATSTKADAMKKRPQNFNADGSVKSPKQRVESGTANDTDKLMALEGEEREVAFANERAKSKVQGDVAQIAYQSALAKLDADNRMRKLGLNPSNAADRARFQDLLRLATH